MNQTIRLLLLLFLFSGVSCAQKTAITNELLGFETEVDSLMQVFNAVGLSVAIIKDEDVVYAKGFGYRDLEKNLPVDEHTVFGIASCTKAFTASILGILESENKLQLSDTPNTYIPELRFSNAEIDNTLKIHHLLSHSTGISGRGFDTSTVLFLSDKDAIVRKAHHFKPLNDIGTQFRYVNSMYAIAGIIGERITNKTWDENVFEMIFNPMEMTSSYTAFNKASKNSNFSYGYAVNEAKNPIKVLPEIIPTKAPAGGIYSSVVDMAKWTKLWLDKGLYDGKQILPKNYIAQATIAKQNISDGVNYGYGWILQNVDGLDRIEHSGAISGYSSNLVFIPSENVGIVILTNQTNSNISFLLTDSILKRLFNLEKENKKQDLRYETVATIEPATTATVINDKSNPTHTLKELTGAYSNPGFGMVQISLKDNTLYAHFPVTTLRLQHREGNNFIDYFTEPIPVFMGNYMVFNFSSTDNSQISELTINLDENPVIFNRINQK